MRCSLTFEQKKNTAKNVSSRFKVSQMNLKTDPENVDAERGLQIKYIPS